jgi:hypothetical protein
MISVNLLSFYDSDSKEKDRKMTAQTIDPSLLPSVSAEEEGYVRTCFYMSVVGYRLGN